jgi:SAM-dependent methyltransferase
MAYQDFLKAFVQAQGIPSVESLLSEHSQRYAFQIQSRDRAKDALDKLEKNFDLKWKGKKVLDVGCAYGSHTIELAKRGAEAVGIDNSAKWLKLAEENARGEAEPAFINCDASARLARQALAAHGPFDIVIVNDVFEHIYDTAGLLENLRALMAPKAMLYFKIPNGLATRHVLKEGHKGVFGISLLPPDFWGAFVNTPFSIYYRRWEYFEALFKKYNFAKPALLNANHDESEEQTKKHISRDLRKIQQHMKLANFKDKTQFGALKGPVQLYAAEVEADVGQMKWSALYEKYRVTFWEGITRSSDK